MMNSNHSTFELRMLEPLNQTPLLLLQKTLMPSQPHGIGTLKELLPQSKTKNNVDHAGHSQPLDQLKDATSSKPRV